MPSLKLRTAQKIVAAPLKATRDKAMRPLAIAVEFLDSLRFPAA